MYHLGRQRTHDLYQLNKHQHNLTLENKNNQFWIAGLAAMILLTGCGTKTKTTPQEQYDALMKTLNILYEQYDNGEVTEAQAAFRKEG